MRFAHFLIAITCIATSLSAPAASTPKQIVTAFFDLAFVKRKPTEAALKYISAHKYIQHNPSGMDGRDAFIKGFAAYVEKGTYRCEIKRVIAEADLVVVHNHCKEDPSNAADRGAAVIDIFRVENDKIVEHWDVEQPVPAQSKNKNTMF
jgi:predicted SnoaL-like aldol condensation-catalyzing enzyme